MDLQHLLQFLIEHAGVQAVYGQPVTVHDRTIVPVANVAFGCGFGSGSERMGGGGGGFRGSPAGYIEVSAAGARFVPITTRKTVAIAALIGAAAGRWLARRRVS